MIKLTSITMTVPEWVGVADNPIQRNTEQHANKARNKHLKVESITQSRVAAARLPDGLMFKLDGHTRALLWAEGSLTPPDYVLVDVYDVQSIQQVEELYQHFDNASAAESAGDKLQGAFRLHHFKPTSTLVNRGGVITAVSLIAGERRGGYDIYHGVGWAIPTLRLIDAENFSCHRFTTGTLAACIVTVHLYGEVALRFWRAYDKGEGVKNGKRRDAVQALDDFVNMQKAAGLLSTFRAIKEICARAITCVEVYKRGRDCAQIPKRADLGVYFNIVMNKDAMAEQMQTIIKGIEDEAASTPSQAALEYDRGEDDVA